MLEDILKSTWAGVLGKMEQRYTRRAEFDEIQRYTSHQAWMQRIVAVSSSSTSIAFCLLAIYLFAAMDPAKLVFRHQLIAFLILYDFLKAVVLLIYPVRVLLDKGDYYNEKFCQVVGFFTATAIEGADFAILAFAIHLYLLVFKPTLSLRVKKYNHEHIEGGLYRYRYYVYGLSVLIPLIMASLAYIRKKGYDSQVCWCYLPQRPIWYRFVLSWVPRYVVVVLIVTVYCMIYFHVIREFKTLSKSHTALRQSMHENASIYAQKPSFWSALRFSLQRLKDYFIPNFNILNAQKSPSNEAEIQMSSCLNTVRLISGVAFDNSKHSYETENCFNDSEIIEANLKSFTEKQKNIAKQMKTIFIYPVAYCLVWIFPFILHILLVNRDNEHPVHWLSFVVAFMQPSNGFIDALVFFYRERPWRHTILRNFDEMYHDKIERKLPPNSQDLNQSSRYSLLIEKEFLKNSSSFDLREISQWRHKFCKLKLPLFELPSLSTIGKFQKDRTQKDLEKMENRNHPQVKEILLTDKLDFSDILYGDVSDYDFHTPRGPELNIDNYGDTRGSATSQNVDQGVNSARDKKSNSNTHDKVLGVKDLVIFNHLNIPCSTAHPHEVASTDITNLSKVLIKNKIQSSKNLGSSRGTIRNYPSNSRPSPDDSVEDRESLMDFLDFLQTGP